MGLIRRWKCRLTQRTSTGTWNKPVRMNAVSRGCCLLLVMVGAAAAADWPTFRHDNAEETLRGLLEGRRENFNGLYLTPPMLEYDKEADDEIQEQMRQLKEQIEELQKSHKEMIERLEKEKPETRAEEESEGGDEI